MINQHQQKKFKFLNNLVKYTIILLLLLGGISYILLLQKPINCTLHLFIYIPGTYTIQFNEYKCYFLIFYYYHDV